MFTDETIEQAERGDTAALIGLDERGLLPGADESLQDYVERLRRLQANFAKMQQALAECGQYEVEGVSVQADEQIPASLFDEVRSVTGRLYGFAIDWVPGFYIDPAFSMLFGGCAFYFYPDFFALFIIRKSFATRERWLIYSRRELLAHELCHVARIGLGSRAFEEMLAYQTATSGFRRAVGSIFFCARDAFLLLGGTLLLLVAQVVRVFAVAALPIWPFWALALGIVAFLATRLLRYRSIYAAALRNVAQVAQDRAPAVLFRCTDDEILGLSRLGDVAELRAWAQSKADSGPRWKVIQARFMRLPA